MAHIWESSSFIFLHIFFIFLHNFFIFLHTSSISPSMYCGLWDLEKFRVFEFRRILSSSICLCRDLEEFRTLLLYIIGSGTWKKSEFSSSEEFWAPLYASIGTYKNKKIRAISSMDMKHVFLSPVRGRVFYTLVSWFAVIGAQHIFDSKAGKTECPRGKWSPGNHIFDRAKV